MNLQAKLEGEQAIARAVLAVLPLIEKHFAPFDGKRAHIQTGRSAAFQKVVANFREEAEALTGVQVFIHDQYQAVSAHVKLSRPDPDNKNGGCIYYSGDVYFGEVDTSRSPIGNYKHIYKGDCVAGKEAACQRVLHTKITDLSNAIASHSLLQRVNSNKQKLAPCFRKIFGE